MRTLSATLALVSLLAGGLLPAPARAQTGSGARAALETADDPRDQVHLRARLDPVTHRIEGSLTWRFTNRSARPTSELYWHLYPNAFRSAAHGGSVFLREGGADIRHRQVGVEGHLELITLTQADGTDLLARSTLDVGVPNDNTQLRTQLVTPIEPGGSVELHVRFVTQLPEAVARSGYEGDFHVAAQWFPKLARLEPDGRWAHFPYHGMGEFYADFADYTLDVTAPAGVAVVAAGDAGDVSPDPEGGLRHSYSAPAVHDMVFVAAPGLQVLEDSHELATHAVIVRVAYPPGHEGAARRQLALTRAGLTYFSSVFGEYPYATLTLVLPPDAASPVAGMEYPTLFLSSGDWWGSRTLLPFDAGLATCAHELAHQWFQGLVATNEVRYPALDEGLTTWAGRELFRARRGHASGGRLGSVTFDTFEFDRAWGLARETPRSPLAAAFEFDSDAYYRTVYVYLPLALETVARTWGRERLLRALGSYARAGRLSHPGPEALREAFEQEYGAWFVRDVFDAIFTEGCVLHTELSGVETTCDGAGCRDEVVARRSGCLPLPLEVEVETDRGVERHVFAASVDELRVAVDPGRLVRAQVDPTRRNLTDPRRMDDVRRFAPATTTRRPAGASLATRLLGVFQVLFSLVGP